MHEYERISKFLPLMQSLYGAARDNLGFKPHAKIVILRSDSNMTNPLGKTAHYSPVEKKIGLYTQGRHIKDILRSLAHELVHHNQNCRGDFEQAGGTMPGYAQEDGHLREMEREAYECGNMIFRDWEDNLKEKGARPLFTSTNQYVPAPTSDVVSSSLFEGDRMKKNLKEGTLRNIIRGVIQEMFNDDLNEGDMVSDPAKSMSARAAEEEAEKSGGQPGAVYKGESNQANEGTAKGEFDKDVKTKKGLPKVADEKGPVLEDSGEEEEDHYDHNVDSDEDHIDAIRGHLDALEHDKDYDEGHEEFRESFFPKGRDIRQKARVELNEALMKRWNKIIK